MKILSPILLVLLASLGGCTSYQLSQTSSQGWGQIAAGTSTIISETEAGRKADVKIAAASARLSQYCGALQAAAMGATMFSPEKYHQAAQVAQLAIARYCAAPYQNASQVLGGVAASYQDVVDIQQGVRPAGGV